MARFCSLFSSSSGNATFVGTATDGILIDAGVSAKRLKTALLQRDIDPAKIRAVFVTHEHSDHIKGLRVFASSHHIPVYATRGTIVGMEEAGILSEKFPVYELPAVTLHLSGIADLQVVGVGEHGLDLLLSSCFLSISDMVVWADGTSAPALLVIAPIPSAI